MNLENLPWQYAIIATSDHVLKFHFADPGDISQFAGQRIRVWLDPEVPEQLHEKANKYLGCTGQHVVVHPDDAQRLWPDLFTGPGFNEIRCAICTCMIHTD